MIKRHTSKILFSSIILVIASFIALSLAMWTDILRLQSLISTGEINVDFRNINLEEFYEAENKDVGSCSYVIETLQGVDHLRIMISNGYPGYGCTVGFEAVNTGTIPVIGPFYNVTEIPLGVEIVFNPSDIIQLHPGDSAYYEITVRVLQEANENSLYIIDIAITYIQWNEAHSFISGYVWNDTDNNGMWDPNENPVEGVLIVLERDGDIIAFKYTDSSGYYLFVIRPGTYTVRIIIPAGYTNTTPITIISTVGVGESSVNNNFGIIYITTPGLIIDGQFRQTNVDLTKCPIFLGTLLEGISVTVPTSGIYKGRIISVAPGAFYHILWIAGSGLSNVSVSYTFDYQFNIENGLTGKIRAYVFNITSMCLIRQLDRDEFDYSVNNTSNEANMNVRLNVSLTNDTVILIFTKFKPTYFNSTYEPYGLVRNHWNTIDKFFDVNWEVVSNVGSANGTDTIQIFKK